MAAITYPLTREQSELVKAVHRADNAKLNEELEAVRVRCEEVCKSDTTKCKEHAKEVRKLWRDYYTRPTRGSWASHRPAEYLTEMMKMFDSKVDIRKIHARADLEKRMYYKDVLCTIAFNDHSLVRNYKTEAAAMFDGVEPEIEILNFIKSKEIEVSLQRSVEDCEYDQNISMCRTEEHRRQIHRQHACDPRQSDTPAMSNLRSKWLNLFNSDMSYSEIFTIMNKDIDAHFKLEQELKEKLVELSRGKTAHNKAKIAKAERRLAKENAAKVEMLSKYTFYCTSTECQNLAVPESEERGLLECGICNKLVQDGVRDKLSYFCSDECMERSGVSYFSLLSLPYLSPFCPLSPKNMYLCLPKIPKLLVPISRT